jgi:hypothetical protein
MAKTRNIEVAANKHRIYTEIHETETKYFAANKHGRLEILAVKTLCQFGREGLISFLEQRGKL